MRVLVVDDEVLIRQVIKEYLCLEGYEVDEELIINFEKAFSNKVLYLSYEDTITRKKEQIEKLVGEDLFFIKGRLNTGNSKYYTEISECRDNALVKLMLKNKYLIK